VTKVLSSLSALFSISDITETEFENKDEALDRIEELEDEMDQAAENLEFELAAEIRDKIEEIKRENDLEE
jgi:excinuclease ABC subunit B